VPYWCAARLQPHREGLALHCLALAGYQTYYPQLRDRRIRHGRRVELRPALFPGYAFVLIQLQWHAARWTAGVINLIMDVRAASPSEKTARVNIVSQVREEVKRRGRK
jgi:transcription antitermination factor NusG